MFKIIVNSIMALVLLIVLSMRLAYSWPLMRNQPPAPVVAQESGATIVVISDTDSGAGTLRQALEDAQNGDIITFDTSVLPPTAPVTISLDSQLPDLSQGNLTIDASDAGVILDGSQITTPEFVNGFFIISESNVIRGFQIIGFSDTGIYLSDGSHYNTIGGDRDIGGPLRPRSH
jgi:hypothetical protein